MTYLFFFNDTVTTEIYTLSLHDALPIFALHLQGHSVPDIGKLMSWAPKKADNLVYRGLADLRECLVSKGVKPRSEEHTSELQSQSNLVCRLLLEKKKPTCRSHV